MTAKEVKFGDEARKKLGFDNPVSKSNQPKIETSWE